MKDEKLLEAIGKIDDNLVYHAVNDTRQKKRNSQFKRGAIAACLALVLIAGVISVNQRGNQIPLSDNATNVTAYYTDSPFIFSNSSESLIPLTEEELFTTFDIAIFEGTVSEIRNIVVNFDGDKAYRAIAKIKVEKVYRGPCSEGDTLSVMLPCPLLKGFWVTDTNTVSAMEVGTTGIFMPMIYNDENSFWEQNGAKIDKRDLADYGFADGERYAFLETADGLVFSRDAYSSIANATTLDEIEKYIETMLENLNSQDPK